MTIIQNEVYISSGYTESNMVSRSSGYNLFCISIYSTDIENMLSFYDLRRSQKYNEILKNQIIEQENKINILIDEMNSLKEKDENIRELLNIPSINDDIRKLGIGGRDSIQSFNDLNYLLPNNFDLDKLPKNNAFIERSVNLEKLSYKEIESDPEIWIERIPYPETRFYAKKVL